jgi:hypothetical protein
MEETKWKNFLIVHLLVKTYGVTSYMI